LQWFSSKISEEPRDTGEICTVIVLGKKNLKDMQSVDTWMRDAQSDKGEGGSAMVREDSECGGEREDGVRVWDEMREWRWEGFFAL